MTRKGTIFLAVALGIGLMLVISAWALPNPKALPGSHEKAVRLPCQGSQHLDQNEIQYRYVKTTDYGHSWSGIQQAGDLSDFEGWSSPMYDFGSICDDQNNLHYVGVLNAFADTTDNGIYHVGTTDGGTTWLRNLIIAQGTNTFTWANAAIDPSGNLYCLIWGKDANEDATFWASKSTNHGVAWSAPVVVAAEPTIHETAQYPHLAEKASADYFFFIFQDANVNRNQFCGRFPTSMSGTATIVNLNAYSGSEYSYYIGACMPMAYDVANNALFCCFRNSDVSATAVYLSQDQGATFDGVTITGAQRYPSVAADPAAEFPKPWIFSNGGVPATGAYHKNWYAFDELGYNSGNWTGRTFLDSLLYGGTRDLLYVHQGYFSGANAISMCNVWGQFTPEGLWVNYSTDGGATWAGGWKLWDIFDDGLVGGFIEQCQLDGGTGGVAYVTFCAQYGQSDLEGPVIANQTLVTPATSLGPYVVSADFSDFTGVDYDNRYVWVNWNPDTMWSYTEFDSVHFSDPETFSGTYYFTIPDTHSGGSQIADGDTIWFYCDGQDVVANYSAHAQHAVVAGHVWLDVKRYPHPAQPTVYTLYGNFPNPFNPTTTIKFDVALPAQVELRVFNTLGQEVATLVNERLHAGSYSIPFDASNLTSGIYIYRLSANGFSESRKMLMLK